MGGGGSNVYPEIRSSVQAALASIPAATSSTKAKSPVKEAVLQHKGGSPVSSFCTEEGTTAQGKFVCDGRNPAQEYSEEGTCSSGAKKQIVVTWSMNLVVEGAGEEIVNDETFKEAIATGVAKQVGTTKDKPKISWCGRDLRGGGAGSILYIMGRGFLATTVARPGSGLSRFGEI